MITFRSATSLLAFSFATPCIAQSGAVIPQSGAGHANQASCIILKRMGPADEVTSRLYSFGIRGKQFQYVEGKLPEGFPFHGRLTDHDVRNLQARGAEVIVVEPHYTTEDLKQARADCRGETGTTPNQSEAKGQISPDSHSSAPANPGTSVANPVSLGKEDSNPAPAANAALSNDVVIASKLSIASAPDGADIEIDGSFVGNTPSDVQVSEGDHVVTVKKSGFKDWERKLKVSAGSNVHLNAELEKMPGS
jgi:hypothetical protein